MDSLPDPIFQYILSRLSNARDVACCNCVSKRWKESMVYNTSLYFPRISFENLSVGQSPEKVVRRMVSRVVRLEELIVYSPYSPSGLASWLSLAGPSLSKLELRMDNLAECFPSRESPSKLDCIGAARNLKCLKLWGVLMTRSPKWDVLENLRTLEITDIRLEEPALTALLQSCPYLRRFLLLECEGVISISIDLPYLEQCKLNFYGRGDCSLTLNSSKIESLEVRGCSWIRVPEAQHLRKLSISNCAGRVYVVEFGKLPALESLSMRGVQWCWDVICKMLKLAREVKHLYMKVDYSGDFEDLQPFPAIDFVGFFDSHPQLREFDIHGAMFAALCQRKSLKHVDPGILIPCFEEVVVTVRSPLNAEQIMSTPGSMLRYGKNLSTMVIKILQMKSSHSSADDFFDEICRFRYMNHRIVRIE